MKSKKDFKFLSKQIDKLLKVLEVKGPVKGEAAVFFDIDGTVSRNDNLEMLITEIVKRDLLPSNKLDVIKKTRKLWKRRELDFQDYLRTVIEIIPNLKNFSQDILKKIAADVVKGEGSHYYITPWTLLLRLKGLGYKLVAVSGAPKFMARMYLNGIGLLPWKIDSTEYVFKKGIFTGEVDLSILKDKGKFINRQYKDQFDFSRCIALGDTASDIPMLKSVGKAIAINPTHALAKEAQKNKWTVVMERKDLVLIFPEGKLKL